MKRFLLLCLIGMAALNTHAATVDASPPIQAFSAVLWTTTILNSPTGKTTTFMRRTVYTRDISGNVRSEIYRPTRGLLHDTTAPLEHVLTGSTSAQATPLVQSSKGSVEQDTDLGTLQFSGLPATGRRKTFKDANGQRAGTQETWFCSALGLTVHMESHSTRGDTVVTDLSDLQLGNPVSSSATKVPVAQAIPLLGLYRGLFTQIAHMERDRLANDPNRHVNMDEIEDRLRKKLGLSAGDWKVLIAKSVKVQDYTRNMSKQAHSFADQDRAARKQNPTSANTLAAGRAKLHQMQLDLNTHVQVEIDQMKTALGPDATTRVEAYLQGPLAASTTRVSLTPAQLLALRSQKEPAQ